MNENKREIKRLTKKEVENLAVKLVSTYGNSVRKHDVRVIFMINERVKDMSDALKDLEINIVWKKVDELMKTGLYNFNFEI